MHPLLSLLLLISSTVLAQTSIPFEREVPRRDRYQYFTSNYDYFPDYLLDFGGDEQDQLYQRGFSFENSGPNIIVPTRPLEINHAYRSFNFVTDDGSQRENYLWVTETNGSGENADFMETVMVFLPRKNQMHIEVKEDLLVVTLPTGEHASFHRDQKILLSGVLSERAIDLNPSRRERKFADVQYHGEGVVIRADARAADPCLSATVQVQKKGRPSCRLAGKLFWTQDRYPTFRYTTDADVFKVIEEHCGRDYLP